MPLCRRPSAGDATQAGIWEYEWTGTSPRDAEMRLRPGTWERERTEASLRDAGLRPGLRSWEKERTEMSSETRWIRLAVRTWEKERTEVRRDAQKWATLYIERPGESFAGLDREMVAS